MTLPNSSIDLRVMEYDCDGYGHLNNARTVAFFEKGRLALQRAAGVEDSFLREQDIGLAVRESTYEYHAQVFPGERVQIRSTFKPYNGGVSIYSTQGMYRNDDLVASAETQHVFIRMSTGRAIRPISLLTDQLID